MPTPAPSKGLQIYTGCSSRYSDCYNDGHQLTADEIAGIVFGSIGGLIVLIICCLLVKYGKKLNQALNEKVGYTPKGQTNQTVQSASTTKPVVEYDENGKVYILTPQGIKVTVDSLGSS